MSLRPSSSKGGPQKFWKQKSWRSMGATRRLKHNAGGQNYGKFVAFAVCLGNFVVARSVRVNFGNGSFSEALAPRSVLTTTRGAKNHGKLAGFAVCLGNFVVARSVRENFGNRSFSEA